MKRLISILIARLLDRFIIESDLKCNPRVIRFVLHYICGSQKPMTLTDYEIKAVANHIKNELASNYITNCSVDPNYNTSGINIIEDYLTSDTLGIVGGFDFTIDDEGNWHCYDTWDFNVVYSYLFIPMPPKLQPAFCRLLDIIKIDWSYCEVLQEISIVEKDLTKFNAKHAFTTTWTVPEEMITCDI